MQNTTLTASPQLELEKLEDVAERSLSTFKNTFGCALAEIHDKRLYREQYASFDVYCRKRWNLNRSRANQIIDAAKLSTMVDSLPSERIARELAPLKNDPAQLRAIWNSIQADHPKPTASIVRERVQAIVSPRFSTLSQECEGGRSARIRARVAILFKISPALVQRAELIHHTSKQAADDIRSGRIGIREAEILLGIESGDEVDDKPVPPKYPRPGRVLWNPRDEAEIQHYALLSARAYRHDLAVNDWSDEDGDYAEGGANWKIIDAHDASPISGSRRLTFAQVETWLDAISVMCSRKSDAVIA